MAAVWSVLPLLFLTFLASAHGQMYDKLFKKLTSRYQSAGCQYTIPVSSPIDRVHVNVSLNLFQLEHMDADTGHAILQVAMGFMWRDRRLRWNPSEFNNIDKIHIPHTFIWKPDIVLYNGHTEAQQFEAIVSNDGAVMLYPKMTIKTKCTVGNSTTERWCVLKFGSWTYDGSKISPRVTGEEGTLAEYIPAPGWDIESAGGKRLVLRYPCCTESYPALLFTLIFRQKSYGWF